MTRATENRRGRIRAALASVLVLGWLVFTARLPMPQAAIMAACTMPAPLLGAWLVFTAYQERITHAQRHKGTPANREAGKAA